MKMKTRVIAMLLVMLMAFGSTLAVFASPFKDVASDNDYARAIDVLTSVGVIQGTSDDTFSPKALVTRQQMALFIARLVTNNKVTDSPNAKNETTFKDLKDPTYFAAINYCFQAGIIDGVSPTSFEPSRPVAFKEALKMAIVALLYNTENYKYPGTFITMADEVQLYTKLDDLSVDAEMTREQVAQLLYNMFIAPRGDMNGKVTEGTTLKDKIYGFATTTGTIVATEYFGIDGYAATEAGKVTVKTASSEATIAFKDLDLAGEAWEYLGAKVQYDSRKDTILPDSGIASKNAFLKYDGSAFSATADANGVVTGKITVAGTAYEGATFLEIDANGKLVPYSYKVMTGSAATGAATPSAATPSAVAVYTYKLNTFNALTQIGEKTFVIRNYDFGKVAAADSKFNVGGKVLEGKLIAGTENAEYATDAYVLFHKGAREYNVRANVAANTKLKPAAITGTSSVRFIGDSTTYSYANEFVNYTTYKLRAIDAAAAIGIGETKYNPTLAYKADKAATYTVADANDPVVVDATVTLTAPAFSGEYTFYAFNGVILKIDAYNAPAADKYAPKATYLTALYGLNSETVAVSGYYDSATGTWVDATTNVVYPMVVFVNGEMKTVNVSKVGGTALSNPTATAPTTWSSSIVDLKSALSTASTFKTCAYTVDAAGKYELTAVTTSASLVDVSGVTSDLSFDKATEAAPIGNDKFENKATFAAGTKIFSINYKNGASAAAAFNFRLTDISKVVVVKPAAGSVSVKQYDANLLPSNLDGKTISYVSGVFGATTSAGAGLTKLMIPVHVTMTMSDFPTPTSTPSTVDATKSIMTPASTVSSNYNEATGTFETTITNVLNISTGTVSSVTFVAKDTSGNVVYYTGTAYLKQSDNGAATVSNLPVTADAAAFTTIVQIDGVYKTTTTGYTKYGTLTNQGAGLYGSTASSTFVQLTASTKVISLVYADSAYTFGSSTAFDAIPSDATADSGKAVDMYVVTVDGSATVALYYQR